MLLSLISLLLLVFNNDGKPIQRPSPQMYLIRYGYLNVPPSVNTSGLGLSVALDPKEMSDAIKLFQQKNRLTVTGIMDDATSKKLMQARCGVSDILRESAAGVWKQNFIKYKLQGKLTMHLPENAVREAFKDAFDYWAQVTRLQFVEVFDLERADINIIFRKWDHGDAYPFDGEDGTLAHAFFPSDGRIHFDDDETFTEGEDRGYNLRVVAAHEIGHALGLPHSNDPDALMSAYYAGYIPKGFPLLQTDDITKIQDLYGAKETSTNNPSTVITTSEEIVSTTIEFVPTISYDTNPFNWVTAHQWEKPKPGDNEPDVCSVETKLSAAFVGKDSHLYLVIRYKDYQWVYQNILSSSKISETWPYETAIYFKGVIPRIDAAIYVANKKSFYIFSGAKIFRYDEFGYYIYETDSGKDFSFAFNTPEEKSIVVTKDNMAWEFDTETMKLDSPKSLNSIYQGLPDNIDAASEDYPWPRDIQNLFFFKGRDYYRYNINTRQVTKSEMNLGDVFFGCKQYPVPKY